MRVEVRRAAVLTAGAWIVACASSGAAASSLSTLHSFIGPPDGTYPAETLLFDTYGVIYGTTQRGGASNLGTVFQLTPPAMPGGKWTENVLYPFAGGADGAYPGGALVFNSYGLIFGTTMSGGAGGAGTVYRLTPPATPGGAWTEAVLYQFRGGADGATPSSGLVFDSFGALYGTTQTGGANNAGTVYKLTPNSDGSWTKTTLFNFDNAVSGGDPAGGLIFDTSGTLYGAASSGPGASASGAVFKLAPPPTPGGAWTATALHSFTGSPDGAGPVGSLFFDTAGALYGMTASGGTGNAGTAFQLTRPSSSGGAWTETVLYSFSGGADGGSPQSAAILDMTGALYGTVQSGGASNLGAVFKLTPPAAPGGVWSNKTVYSFGGSGGSAPTGSLSVDGSGAVYGMTTAGGAQTGGTVFQLMP